MKFRTSVLLLAVLLSASLVKPAHAAVQTNIKVPINIDVFVPCAIGGRGELVSLSGDLHVLIRFAMSPSGAIHSGIHFQPQGISGIGQTTGDKYQGTGVTQDLFNAKVGSEETFINNFRIIGQGPGNNFLVHDKFHITIHANGTVSAFADMFSIDCR